MYKDKDKQREANKRASRRRRDRKGMTQGMTNQGMTVTGSDTRVIPKEGVTVIDERSNEPSNVKPDEGVTNPCKYCGKQLEFAVLECCNDCALEQPSKPVSPAIDGHTLASRPALEFTGKLTDFEREHYKPASKLKPGKYNPVSKPGDSHYEA